MKKKIPQIITIAFLSFISSLLAISYITAVIYALKFVIDKFIANPQYRIYTAIGIPLAFLFFASLYLAFTSPFNGLFYHCYYFSPFHFSNHHCSSRREDHDANLFVTIIILLPLIIMASFATIDLVIKNFQYIYYKKLCYTNKNIDLSKSDETVKNTLVKNAINHDNKQSLLSEIWNTISEYFTCILHTFQFEKINNNEITINDKLEVNGFIIQNGTLNVKIDNSIKINEDSKISFKNVSGNLKFESLEVQGGNINLNNNNIKINLYSANNDLIVSPPK